MKTKTDFYGFTLFELTITLTIIAIVATLGIPNLIQFLNKLELRDATNQLAFDLMYARNYAVKRTKPVVVVFSPGGATWCYSVHDNASEPNCDCNSANSCTLDENEFRVTSAHYRDVEILSANFAGQGDYTGFEPMRGMPVINGAARNGTIWLKNRSGAQAVIISRIGRIRTCAAGEKNCPLPPN